MNTNILKTLAVIFTTVLFVSCDKDYNTIGGDIIGGENFDYTPGEEFGIKVYNQKLGAVQTNNLAINQLGYYRHPVFGETQSNFVTQLSFATKPVFGANIVVDSVVMTVPYFSKKTVDSDGKATYELLNMNGSGVIDLAVFRNTYELGDYDPNNDLTTDSKYYSDQDATFNNYKSGVTVNVNPAMGDARLNDRNYDPSKPYFPSENLAFKPSAKEIIKYKVVSTKNESNPSFYVMEHNIDKTQVEEKLAPALRLKLNKDYFDDNVIKAPSTKWENNAAFKNYFRGLSIRAQNIVSGDGNTMSLDFSKGSVTIYYKEDRIITATESNVVVLKGNDRPMKTLILSMAGNTVNLFNHTDSQQYLDAFTPVNQPTEFEAQNLYIKGGDGSLGFVELFIDPVKLQELKDKNPLINEASLIFTINESIMTSTVPGEKIPSVARIYLYDVEEQKALIDYSIDGTVNVSDAKKSKYIFDGILEEIKDDAGIVIKRFYKFRITEFVNRILKGDQENVRLAVVVTDNISDINTNELKTNITRAKFNTGGNEVVKKVQAASTYNPLGTVLYGSNGDNRVKFIINYTTKN
ncbi:MAG: DUF4270 domain-containing protein [Bacteroidota bacterium]